LAREVLSQRKFSDSSPKPLLNYSVSNALEKPLFGGKKFDVVVGNPPYNEEVKDSDTSFYTFFIKKSIELLKPNGQLAYVTPYSWIGKVSKSKKIDYQTINQYQLDKLVLFDNSFKFFKAGTTVCYFIMRPFIKKYQTNIIQKTKASTFEFADYIPEGKSLPSIFTNESLSIHNKLVNLEKVGFKFTTECHGQHLKLNNLVEDHIYGAYEYKTYYSHRLIRYASKKMKDFEYWKCMIAGTSDISTAWIDEKCNTNEDVMYLVFESKKEAEHQLKILGHPIYQYISKMYRRGKKLSGVELFPKIEKIDITLEQLGFSNDEIRFINNSIVK
jgi:hypothetical protein